MVDREHMKSLTEKYRGRAAHAKNQSKLRGHADHLKALESHGDHSGYLVYLASKMLRDAQAAKAARAIEGIEAYTGDSKKLKGVQDLLKHTLLLRYEKKLDDFHDWFAFKDMMGLKKGLGL